MLLLSSDECHAIDVVQAIRETRAEAEPAAAEVRLTAQGQPAITVRSAFNGSIA